MQAQPGTSHPSRILVALSDEPLDVAAALRFASAPECGGVGLFVGTVRLQGSEDALSPVVQLEYEAHLQLAEEKLGEIAQSAVAKWDIRRVWALHRIGICKVGEPTIIVATGAPHRAEALEACRWIIDSIKAEVPIWKREVYEDGSAWVGAGS